jgi:hypothetical protein
LSLRDPPALREISEACSKAADECNEPPLDEQD